QRVAAAVLCPTFGNPLGHCMPEPCRRELVELLASHGVPLIEDDVYGDLPFEGERPKAAKAYDSDGGVLLCSSFSKTLAPGYRVGWVAPGRYREQVERLKFNSMIAAPTPTQMAVAAFLAHGGYDRHLRRLRRTYRDLVAKCTAAIAQHFPAETRVSRPRGGHVLWVELPEDVDALHLYEKALDAGISIAPGPIFSASGRYRNCIRLNCALPWTQEVENAVRALGELAAG
ncbi:MAG: PLP-dependent aminotransferase family protein, partial [Thermoanaerobaculia bacterium]|nr:PLP-dependent aminotransferase family protein [Thermoanaerobaculia bacterium]